ncbi:MAG: hypothetical protein ABJF10_23115 [Chthoniobacter sp.]|uniref:hypothetical protein n=1 Tax=Chthoniobacter sp. TaxID=2510640 RepID=UPI0032ABB599
MKHFPTLLAGFTGILFGATALAGENDKKTITPTEPEPSETWQFSLSLPGWIPWQTGEVGINGATSHLKLGPNDIIPKLDMIASVRAEAHKGRFGIMGEYSYMSLSDGVGTPGLVKKLDVRLDQHLGELALSWRLIESPRGWLDAFAGVRYTNLYQAVGIHPDDGAIEQASRGLVDALADRLAKGARERLVPLVQERITDRLASLRERDPVLPQGPLGDALRGALAQRVQAIIKQRQAELDGAIKSGIRARIDAAKAKLSHDLASAIKDQLNTRVARTDDWWDPFVGLRGHYDLSKAFYLTGRADIGGFGVGSELSWQVNAGIGCHLTRNFYTEMTYRLYDVNYRHDGLIYDVLTHGIELSAGINF